VTRYLLDGRSLQDQSSVRGIGTYMRGLLAGYESLGVTGDVGLLLERGSELPPHLVTAGFAAHPATLRPLNRHLRPMLDPFQIRRALGSHPPLLYHATEYGQPLFPRTPVVVTVHDLIPFVMPREYHWMRRERALPMRQFRSADAVIAVSRSTADDVQRLAGVDPARISVISEGVAPHRKRSEAELSALKGRLRLPGRFVLAVGTFDPRKRVGLLAEVVRGLRAHHDIGLVVAGSQGSFAASVESALSRAGLTGHARVLGHVGDEELGGLYQMSECLLFTSAYEGFGLPPLEAMASGTAVAVFDNSSLREVVADVGLVIADGDVAAMVAAVTRLLADPVERRRRGEQGRERAATLTWHRAAAATLSVYSQVLSSR
jgi:glycosyltransferase involved in cell wall biosynthesis